MEPNIVPQNTPESRNEASARNTNNTVSFLALGVAVAALVLAWVVYTNKPGEDFKDTVQTETVRMDQNMEAAAEKTGEAVTEGVGAAMEKTGEALQNTGEATQDMGKDIKTEGGAMQR